MIDQWSSRAVTQSTIAGRSRILPPADELPALLVMEPLIWRSADSAIAVLTLEVYTTGVEFTVIGRIRNQGLGRRLTDNPRFIGRAIGGQDEDEMQFSVRAADELVPVDVLGADCNIRGFRCRGWVSTTDDILTFSLEWPAADIHYAEHEIEGVQDAAGRAIRLWVSNPER
jgi:hypothetical protein